MAVFVDYLKKLLIEATEIPAKTAKLTRTLNAIENSNFSNVGSAGIVSRIAGLAKWGVDFSGILSTSAGYLTSLKKGGTPTTMTGEACALVSGKIYHVTDATKRCIDPATAVVVYDGGVDHTSDVQSIDYNFGVVTFKSAYTVTGSVTVDAKYIPLTTIVQNGGSYDLTLTGKVLDATTRDAAQSNGGYMVNAVSLIDASMSIQRMDDLAGVYAGLFDARAAIMVEVSMAGGALVGRGWFVMTEDSGDGAVDGIEMEDIKLVHQGQTALDGTAVIWSYISTASLNAGLKALLDNFFARTAVTGDYLIDGTNGWEGDGLVSAFSIKGDMDTEQFSGSLVSAGALAATP